MVKLARANSDQLPYYFLSITSFVELYYHNVLDVIQKDNFV
jgi:hypothetical protein